MCADLVPRSSYPASSITKASAYDVQLVAEHAAKVTTITQVANQEIAAIGSHAVAAMAQVVQGAEQTRYRLTVSGGNREVYEDAQSKILQVTGTNIITIANTAQKEVLQQAAAYMR